MAVSRLSQQSIQQAFPKGNTIWDGTTATSAFDSLGTVVLRTATDTITFSNIPQTYTHLQIRSLNVSSGTDNDIAMKFNSDATTNYSLHAVYGNGTTASVYSTPNASYCSAGYTGDSTYPQSSICDILDYSNTNKYKTVRTLTGGDRNGATNYVVFISSNWRNTAALTSITIYHGNIAGGKVFNANSSFALYGIK